MSAFNYGRSRATADRLITRFGRRASIRSRGVVTGPDWEPSYGPPASRDCIVVVTNYSASDVDGTLVRMTDRKMLVPAGAGPVAQNDEIFVDAKRYQVMSVTEVAPGPVVIMYEVQARGA